jgi:predicted metalloprotease with PDZ domain
MLGDYAANPHLQGEVLGAMLDLIIRDATSGRSSMDDVMRKMLERFSGEKGFTSKDVEQTVRDICGCNVSQFFQDHVYGNKQIDFGKYLRLLGLQHSIEWQDVLSSDLKPVPDLRAFAYQVPGENDLRIAVSNPKVAWAKAGLHTGDIIKTMNGKTLVTSADFRTMIRNAKIGDTVTVEVERPSGVAKINVLVTGYQQPVARITRITSMTAKQQKLLEDWIAGK